MSIRNFKSVNPMFAVTICVIVGILLAHYWAVIGSHWITWGAVSAIVVAVVAIDLARHNSLPLIFVLLAAASFLFYVLRSEKTITPQLIYDHNIEFTAQAADSSRIKGRYALARVQLISYKDSITKIWQEAQQKVELNIDTSLKINLLKGNVIAFRGKLRRMEGSYGEWLARQGVAGKVYSYRAAIIDSGVVSPDFNERMAHRRASLADKIYQIDTTQKAATAIMSALTISEKSQIPRPEKAEYRRAGVSHLLAISGLHVGIIFAILNLMFGFVRLWRNGRVVFGVLVIALLWSYALLTGMSASVLRAVVMFSLFQLAIITWRGYSSLNILSTAALILLIADPNYIFDIGFQLSFAAMLGITTLYRPVWSLLRVENRVLAALWGVTVVSITAQIAVAPLVVLYFGQIPLAGIFLNIVVWITVPLIIVGSFVFLFTSIHFIGLLAMYVSVFQNYVIGRVAGWRYSAIEGIEMSALGCVLVYAVIIALAYWFVRVRERRLRLTLLSAKYNF